MKPTFFKLDDQLCRALLMAMHNTPGQEICGFLVEQGKAVLFRRIPNLGGAGEFWVDQVSFDRILSHIDRTDGIVRAFVHSHATDTNLSLADEAAIRSSPWPWLVVVPRGETIKGKWFWNEVNGVHSRKIVGQL